MKGNDTRSGEPKPAGVDWGELHRRSEALGRALAPGLALSPEARKNILRERAKALAMPPWEQRVKGAQEWIDIVEFGLANETYAIETTFVREVYPLQELTPLPGTPPFVSGIINVRGQILSVMDIKKFFDLPEKGLTDLHKVIVIRQGGMELGILADEVFGVRSLPIEEIGLPLLTLMGIRAEYLRGVTKEAVVILDAAKMLADPKIVVNWQ
ncbi:MAG: hypothetical protein A2064_10590 [Spirochaetes bacterium GWB1_66_5]|nr:MAG: hypothetical protein A2064_10590 [Spirochaetes bacterium GWB1_66_5]